MPTLDQKQPAEPTKAGTQFGTTAGQSQWMPRLNQFADLFNMVNAPSQALAQQQIHGLQGQYGDALAGSQLQGQQAQQQYGFDTRSLGIEKSQLDRARQLNPQLFGLNMQDLDAQQAALQRNSAESLQSFIGGQAASGGLGSAATPQGQSDIAFQLSQGMGKIGRERTRATLQQKETMAQVNDTAKSLGIKGEELQSRLKNTLAQLGIQDDQATQQLFGEIAKIQQGEFSPIAGFIGQIFQMAQLGNPFGTSPGGGS